MDTHLLGPLYLGGLSCTQIAVQIERSYSYVQSQLKKEGITRRSNSESVHLAKRVAQIKPSDSLLELIDGLLLGDACILAGAIGSRLVLVQTVKHKPWVDQVTKELELRGVVLGKPVSGKAGVVAIGNRTYNRKKAIGLRTRSYAFLTSERARWYPMGMKRVPRNIKLTPLSVAHWYFGDGGVGGKGYHARFCTDGFTEEDVDFLICELKKTFNWNPIREKRNRILICKMSDRASLLSMIQDVTPDCFRHKLEMRVSYKHRPLSSIALQEQLVALRRSGASYGDIARKLSVSKSSVHYFLSRHAP